MDIYLRDYHTNNYDRLYYIDEFESFIWTERYAEYGDFEMTLNPSRIWSILVVGRYVSHSETKRLMVIEEREEWEDAEGKQFLTIKGRSMEAKVLTNRSVTPNLGNTNLVSEGTLGAVVQNLVNRICVTGSLSWAPEDVYPSMYAFDATTDKEVIKASIKFQSLYSAVKELCDSKGFGFGIDLRESAPWLRFFVSQGVDRPNIVFSSDMDTLQQERHLFSIANEKTHAYVQVKDTRWKYIVAAAGHSLGQSGFDRSVLAVEASDIAPGAGATYAEYAPIMFQRGREELAKHNKTETFDAQLTGLDPYVFHTHYTLGDHVTFIDKNKIHRKVAITEYIWSVDAEGEKRYPTFKAVL